MSGPLSSQVGGSKSGGNVVNNPEGAVVHPTIMAGGGPVQSRGTTFPVSHGLLNLPASNIQGKENLLFNGMAANRLSDAGLSNGNSVSVSQSSPSVPNIMAL